MPDEIGLANKIAPLEKIDILVPTHGKLEHTIRCLHTLYHNTATRFHLIICDDSKVSTTDNQDNPVDSLDVTEEYLLRFAETHPNVTYVKRAKPYISGNQFFNDAIRHMETPYLATIMNSMQVEPEWERIALKLMRENPKIGVVGFKCLFPDTYKIECAGIQFANGYMPIDVGRDLPSHALTTIYEVEAIQWAFALVRREAVEGNLDEHLFYGFKGWDDIDNCLVLRSKGWKVFYCGYGVGVHHPRVTRGTNSADGYLKNKGNAIRFWKRWGFWNAYLESRTMDVTDKITDEMKNNLKAVFTEYQMCQSIAQQSQMMLEARNSILQNLTADTLTNQLKVSPEEYMLGMDPAKDVWDLKRKPVPENTNTVQAGKPNEVAPAIAGGNGHNEDMVAQALKDKAEAEQRLQEKLRAA